MEKPSLTLIGNDIDNILSNNKNTVKIDLKSRTVFKDTLTETIYIENNIFHRILKSQYCIVKYSDIIPIINDIMNCVKVPHFNYNFITYEMAMDIVNAINKNVVRNICMEFNINDNNDFFDILEFSSVNMLNPYRSLFRFIDNIGDFKTLDIDMPYGGMFRNVYMEASLDIPTLNDILINNSFGITSLGSYPNIKNDGYNIHGIIRMDNISCELAMYAMYNVLNKNNLIYSVPINKIRKMITDSTVKININNDNTTHYQLTLNDIEL